MKTYKIAIVIFEGISDFHLSVPLMVFGQARPEIDLPHFEVQLCAQSSACLKTAAGFRIEAYQDLNALSEADIIIVPSWDITKPTDKAMCQGLYEAYARGATLVGLCLGTFLLAQAGVIEGKEVTTHWRWATHLAENFPDVQVNPDVLYIDEGRILTSAGTVAGLDCCLHLLRKLAGSTVTNSLARLLVTPPHRQGGQAQYIQQPIYKQQDKRLANTLEWAQKNLQQPLNIEILATHAAMSRRTFTRHFRAATGCSVMEWLTIRRLFLAQQLLESTTLSIEKITEDTGFGSVLSFRQQFMRAFQVTPSQYRREFGGMS